MKIFLLIALFFTLKIFLFCNNNINNRKEIKKHILNLSPTNIKNNKNLEKEEEFMKEIKKYLIKE